MESTRTRLLAGLALAAVAVLAVASVALAETPVIRFKAADQAAAKAIVLKAADLGTGWKGGPQKPDLSDASLCDDWNPKQSDLVLTGAAESEFATAGAMVSSAAYILQTPRMVQLDWARTVVAPAAQRCLRKVVSDEPGLELVSFKRLSFPKLAPYATRFRAVAYATRGTRVDILMDFVFIGRGRTELLLMVVAPHADRAAADAAEVRLARIMLGRTPA